MDQPRRESPQTLNTTMAHDDAQSTAQVPSTKTVDDDTTEKLQDSQMSPLQLENDILRRKVQLFELVGSSPGHVLTDAVLQRLNLLDAENGRLRDRLRASQDVIFGLRQDDLTRQTSLTEAYALIAQHENEIERLKEQIKDISARAASSSFSVSASRASEHRSSTRHTSNGHGHDHIASRDSAGSARRRHDERPSASFDRRSRDVPEDVEPIPRGRSGGQDMLLDDRNDESSRDGRREFRRSRSPMRRWGDKEEEAGRRSQTQHGRDAERSRRGSFVREADNDRRHRNDEAKATSLREKHSERGRSRSPGGKPARTTRSRSRSPRISAQTRRHGHHQHDDDDEKEVVEVRTQVQAHSGVRDREERVDRSDRPIQRSPPRAPSAMLRRSRGDDGDKKQVGSAPVPMSKLGRLGLPLAANRSEGASSRQSGFSIFGRAKGDGNVEK